MMKISQKISKYLCISKKFSPKDWFFQQLQVRVPLQNILISCSLLPISLSSFNINVYTFYSPPLPQEEKTTYRSISLPCHLVVTDRMRTLTMTTSPSRLHRGVCRIWPQRASTNTGRQVTRDNKYYVITNFPD